MQLKKLKWKSDFLISWIKWQICSSRERRDAGNFRGKQVIENKLLSTNFIPFSVKNISDLGKKIL